MDSSLLKGVEQTLFLPLVAKARENRRRRPIIADREVAGVVSRLGIDESQYRLNPFSTIGSLFRARRFDAYVREYLAASPDGMIIEIGVGLDTRFWRTDNGRARWFLVDLPNVIALRRELFAPHERVLLSEAPLATIDWERAIGTGPRPLIVSEGCLVYIDKPVVLETLRRLGHAFPGAVCCFDVVAEFVAAKLRLKSLEKNAVVLGWGCDDSRSLLEELGEGVLLEEWRYYDKFEWRNGILNLFKLVPRLNNLFRVLKVELGASRRE